MLDDGFPGGGCWLPLNQGIRKKERSAGFRKAMRKQQEARNLKKTKSLRGASKKKEQMLFGLNVDLRPFFLFGLFLILFFSPFMRGLFFPPEFLPACILVGSTFIICVFDQVLRREIFVPRLALDWAVLAFVFAWALSLIGAVHLVSALRELMEAAACAFLYVCAARAARNENSFDLLLLICYLSGIGVALIGILAAAGIFPFPGGSSPNLCVNSLWQIRSPRFKLHLPGYRHYSPPSAVFLC